MKRYQMIQPLHQPIEIKAEIKKLGYSHFGVFDLTKNRQIGDFQGVLDADGLKAALKMAENLGTPYRYNSTVFDPKSKTQWIG